MNGQVAPSHRRLRVLLYGQHLSGVGHYVRTYEIARALAEEHEVHLVEGGKPVPRTGCAGIRSVELPPLVRTAGIIEAAGGGQGFVADTPAVFRERQRLLADALGSIRPDILIIEHYPFSRWDLAPEITGLLLAARAARPPAKIICSVRDIPRQTVHEGASRELYVQEVLARLHNQFDALMIHADARFTRLEEFFPAVADICLPVEYTGIVSEKLCLDPGKGRMISELTGGSPFILVSVGGGTDPGGLISRCIDAWDLLVAGGAAGARRLVLAEGLGWPAGRHREIEARLRDKAAILLPFTADFLHWMQATELSVSCAGYNTCANILETGARALLIPNPDMPDQSIRAARLAAHGLAEALEPHTLTTERLADAIAKALARPRAGHDLELNGAGRTREFIGRLAG